MRLKQILQPDKTLLEDQRTAALIVSDVLMELKNLTKPDVSLEMLDELAERMIRERGATPYNKGYKPEWSEKPYPSTICASVDYEVCHAAPSGRSLHEGSIVTYDLSVKYKSGCGDAALTVPVGAISNRQQRAIRYGLGALYAGIQAVKAGARVGQIGEAIQRYCGRNGYQIIREFGGHRIGKEMHMDPQIANFDDPKGKFYDFVLEEGMIICIEPMITPGNAFCRQNPVDGWTIYCPDKQPVVMFEHMVLVKEGGFQILTNHLNNPL